MAIRILIMGLPGAGKTTLAEKLRAYIESFRYSCLWLNADKIRAEYNDWDFSYEGRSRQAQRMRKLADTDSYNFAICDFVAPYASMRIDFDAQYTIWLDTITESRFKDTNNIFEPPIEYDFRITEQNADKWAEIIGKQLVQRFK